MVERDNAMIRMLMDSNKANKRDFALKQREAKQIIRKNTKRRNPE